MIRLILLLISFSLSFLGLNSQIPKPILQKAHNLERIVAISDDDVWALTHSREEQHLTIWNIKAGKIYARYPVNDKFYTAKFISGNNEILINLEIVIDLHSGKVVRNVLSTDSTTQEKLIKRFAIPDATRVFAIYQNSVTKKGFLKVANPVSGVSKSIPLPDNLRAFVANAKGSKVAFACKKWVGKDFLIQVVTMDIEQGRIVDSINLSPEESAFNGILTFSHNDQSVYIGWDKLYKWDLLRKELISFQPQLNGRYFPMVESVDGKHLFAFRVSPKGDSTHLAVLSSLTPTIDLFHDTRINPNWLKDFSIPFNRADPLLFEVQIEGYSHYISARDPLLQKVPIKELNETLSNDNKKTFAYSFKGFESYSVLNRRLLSIIKPYKYTTLAFTSNLKYAYSTTEYGRQISAIYNVKNGFRKIPFIKELGKDRTYAFFDNQHIYYNQPIGLSDSGKYLYTVDNYHDGMAKVYDFETGNVLFKHKMPYLLYQNKNVEEISSPPFATISPDESKFIFDTYQKFIFRKDLKTLKEQRLSYPVKNLHTVSVSTDGSWVTALEANFLMDVKQIGLFIWNPNGERKQRTINFGIDDYSNVSLDIIPEENFLVLSMRDSLHFYSLLTLNEVKKLYAPAFWWLEYGRKERVLRMKLSGGYKAFQLPELEELPYTASNRFTIGFSGEFQTIYKDSLPIANFVMDETNEQMIWLTSAGYYFLPKASADAIGFKYKNNVYPASVFDALYNRPDTIFTMLQPFFGFSNELINSYRLAYQNRVGKLRSNPTSKEIPEVSLSIPETAGKGQRSIIASINAKSTGLDLQTLNVYLNGVPILGKSGRPINGKNFKDDIVVPILAGANEVQVSVSDANGLKSLPATATIFQDDSSAFRPITHFIGIGVSDYRDTSYNLKYAHSDVENLFDLLKKKTKNIKQYILTNSRATRKNILALKDSLFSTKPEDKVILFFCGHGIRKGDYFLATHDMDFDNPLENGLTIDEAYSLLDSIPALNRLILLDACNSGQDYSIMGDMKPLPIIPKDSNVVEYKSRGGIESRQPGKASQDIADIMDEVFSDFSNDYGINVIAASKGNEFAYETKKLKSGVFTYSILQGITTEIEGKASGRSVTIQELRNYVTEMVTRLTRGLQRPSSRNENSKMDWGLW